jgi:hypothetical protein
LDDFELFAVTGFGQGIRRVCNYLGLIVGPLYGSGLVYDGVALYSLPLSMSVIAVVSSRYFHTPCNSFNRRKNSEAFSLRILFQVLILASFSKYRHFVDR